MSSPRTRNGSIGEATVWMIVLSILLFWIPPIGPLIAGFVGGQKAGGTGPALIAALIPAVLAAGLILLLGTLAAVPVIGAIVGAGIFIVILVESVPLLIGALIGGVMSERR